MLGSNLAIRIACAKALLASATVLSMVSPANAHFLPLPPADCTFRDGTAVRFHMTDSNEISLVRTSGDEETVVIGFPDQRRGLTVRAQSGWPYASVVQQLKTMIASPDTFTLQDVAASFDPEKFDTEIGYLSPDMVRCMTKDT